MESAVQQFERPVEHWFAGEYAVIPPHIQDALMGYVLERRPVGGFLQAVITNNLRDTYGRADGENRPLIPLYVQWFCNVPPECCWGSINNMQAWLENRVETL